MQSGFFKQLQRDTEAPIEAEGVDQNFAIHFPIIDRIVGTCYPPEGKWPSGYGVPETVPSGYLAQLKYPFVRQQT